MMEYRSELKEVTRIEFAWYDYLVFIATLILALGVGVYYALAGDKNKTTDSYLMANRSLGVLPVTLSMFMSYISAILVLGNTAELYTYGINQWFSVPGAAIGSVFAVLWFVPLFFPLKIVSIYQVPYTFACWTLLPHNTL